MKKLKDWLTTYKRYYIRNVDIVASLLFVNIIFIILYIVAYQHGWVNSFELFDSIRPHRPIQG